MGQPVFVSNVVVGPGRSAPGGRRDAAPDRGSSVESDANQVFKFSRVLWFPMSVYAISIGTTAVLAFQAWTLLCTAIGGVPGLETTDACVRGFDDALVRWLTMGDWGHLAPVLDGETGAKLAASYRLVFSLQAVGAYLIWSLAAVAMARIMAVRIARDQYLSLRETLAFAWSTRYTALLHAPCVLAPMLFLWGCTFVIGLVGQITWVGWVLNAVLLPLTFLFTIVLRLMGLAGVLSLGLTPAAIATEKSGTYDALGKAYNYIFARPLVVIFYLLLLAAFVYLLNHMVFEPGFLRQHIARVLCPLWSNPTFEQIVKGNAAGLDGVAWFAAWLHRVIYWLLEAVIDGLVLSFLSGALTAMYLIFRRDIDGADYSSVVK